MNRNGVVWGCRTSCGCWAHKHHYWSAYPEKRNFQQTFRWRNFSLTFLLFLCLSKENFSLFFTKSFSLLAFLLVKAVKVVIFCSTASENLRFFALFPLIGLITSISDFVLKHHFVYDMNYCSASMISKLVQFPIKLVLMSRFFKRVPYSNKQF